MSWVCPVCSNTNDDGSSECMVCGHTKVISKIETKDEYKSVRTCSVVYSVFEYIDKSFKDKPIKSKPIKKEKTSIVDKPKTKKISKSSEDFLPWEGHNISIDFDVLKEKGYKKIERSEMSGVKGYKLIKNDDSNQFIRKEMLIVQKIAKKT